MMDKINSHGMLKVTCTYRSDLLTEKQFQCSAIQKCCGSRCCDDENLDTYLMWGGVALLLILCIVGVCWCTIRRRKRSRDILGNQRQLESNILYANQSPKDCILTLDDDNVEKCKSTKSAIFPRNFSSISFTESLFPPPNSKIEKSIAGSHDQKPLLDETHCDGEPMDVSSERHQDT